MGLLEFGQEIGVGAEFLCGFVGSFVEEIGGEVGEGLEMLDRELGCNFSELGLEGLRLCDRGIACIRVAG